MPSAARFATMDGESGVATIAIAVGLGLLVRDGRVLLLKRPGPPYQGFWSMPGGKAEKGEHLQRAAEREIAEELGWELKSLGLRALVHERYEENGAPPQDWLLGVFAFAAPTGAADPPDCAWFALGDLAEADLIPTDRLMIADALGAAPPPAPLHCRRAHVRLGEGGRPLVLFYG